MATTESTTREAKAAELEASAGRHDQEAADSFERCDTDGFVTQWAHGITGRQERLQADIERQDGLWEFPALFSEDGERVAAKLIPTRYGMAWAICDEAGQFTGEFVSNKEKAAAKKGYVLGTEMAPARAETWAPPGARGLAGATQVQVIARRLDGGYPGAPQSGDVDPAMSEFLSSTFHVNQEVETRTGKVGTVVRADSKEDRTVGVKFGSQVYEMKVAQLVDHRTAEKSRSHRTPNYGARG